MPEATSQVAIALLYESADAAAHLRESLGASGVSIAYQAPTADFDRIALEASLAQVVLVNLDPSSDGDLDSIHVLLDDPRYNVIFNESHVSSPLEGWDQARWLRHLLAKIRGGNDADPPRPTDAELIPGKILPSLDDAAEMEVQAAHDDAELPTEAGNEDASISAHDNNDDDWSQLLANVEAVQEESVDAGAGRELSVNDGEPEPSQLGDAAPAGDADFDFDSLFDDPAGNAAALDAGSDAGAADAWQGEALSLDGQDDADAVSGTTAQQDLAQEADTTTAQTPDLGLDFDFDALFDGDDSSSGQAGEATTAPVAQSDNLGSSDDWFAEGDQISSGMPNGSAGDLDLDLDDLDHLFQEGTDSHSAADTVPSGIDADADASGGADGAAEQVAMGLDEELLAALDSEHVAAVEITARSAVGLELAPLDDTTVQSVSPEEFGIETVSAASFLAPDAEAEDLPAEPTQTFDFELVPIEDAIVPRAAEETVSEFRLSAAPVGATAQHISRVWLLVASIGGPEAIRDFVALLPEGLDTLVIVVQDIGSEFIEVMQHQLAAATPLAVRIAAHGERLSHGEVVLVPVERAFAVGRDGKVTLSALQAGATIIDTALHMIADEFGDAATAVVLSGMTNDAGDGVSYLHGRGGSVHVQSAETCVASTLPDGARATGVVGFVGSPQQIAEQLLGAAQ